MAIYTHLRRKHFLSDPTLIAAYAFEENSGTTTADATGNGNTGTLVGGVSWTTSGKNGNALDFNGTTGQVEIDAGPLAMDNLSTFTAMAWVENDIGTGAGTDDIVGWWDYPSSASWIITHHNNNNYFFSIEGKASIFAGTVGTAWTHVAGTYDGSTMRLYVDGTQVASQSGLSGTLPSSTADIIIGGQQNDSNYFDGTIDDVRIYNRALSQSEIDTIKDVPVS